MTAITSAMFLIQVTVAGQTSEIYKVDLLRAAPGELLSLIEWYEERGDEALDDVDPWLLRHSQGDQWDLMVVYPVRSLEAYFSPAATAERARVAERRGTLHDRGQHLIAFREETFFSGPAAATLDSVFTNAGMFHIEMFVALPGMREALVEERVMENVYLTELGRAPNAIFTKVLGAKWDAMTIGFYDNLVAFAESGQAPAEAQERAALTAGFEGADRIGTFLRTLIAEHHDTLAVPVR